VNRIQWQLLSLTLALLSSPIAAKLAPPEKILWLINDAPPFFITEGQHKNTGICDVTLTALKQALPDIQHEELILPHTRIGKYMDEGQHACFPCMIKRPKATNRATYSDGTVVYPPHVLVFAPQTQLKPGIASKPVISLATLLSDESLIFAKHGGRLFGPVLDDILAQHSDEAKLLILRNEGQSTTSVLRLLQIKRADYTIEYPAIVNFFNVTEQQDLNQVLIKENLDQPVVGAVGCSSHADNNFAQRALTSINRALSEIVLDAEYQQNVSHWFNADEQYHSWYQELVIKNGK